MPQKGDPRLQGWGFTAISRSAAADVFFEQIEGGGGLAPKK